MDYPDHVPPPPEEPAAEYDDYPMFILGYGRSGDHGGSGITNFGPTGLKYINANYTMSLTRLPVGPFAGLTALTHCADAGVATGTASTAYGNR